MVPWHVGFMFVGLTGLPHPDLLQRQAIKLISMLGLDDAATALAPAPGPAPFDIPSNSTGGGGNPNDALAAAMGIVMIFLLIIVAWALIQIVFVFCYKSNVFDQRMIMKPDGPGRTLATPPHDFRHGLFGCMENPSDCLSAFCCPAVRFADAHGVITGSFWGALCSFMGVNCLVSICTSFVCGMLFPPTTDPTTGLPTQDPNADSANQFIEAVFRGLFFGIFMRKGLRVKLGGNTDGKALTDFVAWGWCSLCALTQESVEVDIAYDATLGFPCTLTKGRAVKGQLMARERLLGEAVVLEEGR